VRFSYLQTVYPCNLFVCLFGESGILTQGFVFAKLVLYRLGTPVILEMAGGGSLKLFPWAGLQPQSS
jgi:hypothetical protein